MASRVRRKKKVAPAKIARARNPRSEQRQRLIDACISALHIYGPSRTTVEKVTAIAKMSPGIVRFYFASKASMLVASLQFLAAEFEEQVMVPVAELKSTPVAALELLVTLYLDAEIASPRKVSVWYAFWGEASSRQEYYDICGQKDEGFAQLVFDLVERLIADTAQVHLDADGVSLGLRGVLEMIWQEFAFRSEEGIDRAAAKERCLAFLRSVFPGSFKSTPPEAARQSWAPWVYANPRLFALERQRLFRGSWQFVGHASQLQNTGNYIARDIAGDRVLAVRDEMGVLRAFRNTCIAVPHVLVEPGAGQIESINCVAHSLRHELDGRALRPHGAPNLTPLQLRTVGDLILVRSNADERFPVPAIELWDRISVRSDLQWISTIERPVIADWKLVVENWLRKSNERISGSWSARAYRGIAASTDGDDAGAFLAPNQWYEPRADGFSLLQVIPIEAGRALIRQYNYSALSGPVAQAAVYLGARLSGKIRSANLRSIESAQTSIVAFGYEPLQAGAESPALTAFRGDLAYRVPAIDLDRPPEA
jgi:TetR/AcrR family transcriptional regulator, transcriptional repressor of bet genes